MKLIDKDSLLAEIERLNKKNNENENVYDFGTEHALKSIQSFINSLEVKDVEEQKERISECPYRKVGCTMYEDKILECKGACSWVVDHPKLKGLKAQKGG